MPAEIPFDPAIRGESGSRWVDRAIAALASAQHGVIARRQLLDLDVSARPIEIRIGSERLHLVHRGVYAVGHRCLSREAEWLAAVLAGGPGAVLSHESAAVLWGIRSGHGREIDVTVDRGGKRPGIRFHRSPLGPSEVTERKGIPVTTPERTIIDMAATLTPDRLERAIRQAEYEHLTTLASLTSCLSSRQHPPRGARNLRQALDLAGEGQGITRSRLERRFLALLRKHNLPKPRWNVDVHVGDRWIEVDCVWETQRLMVELDGRRAHLNAQAFESDRYRDLELQAAGWTVVRITWRQLRDLPDETAQHLYSLLFRS